MQYRDMGKESEGCIQNKKCKSWNLSEYSQSGVNTELLKRASQNKIK